MTDILDPDYESDLTEEEHNQLVLMSEHAIAPPLSPAAQSVLDAFRSSHTGPGCLAAALRAAADQVVPHEAAAPWNELKCDYDGDHWEMRRWVRHQILAIADELEAQ